MPELSKTARASQVKEVKEKHVETTEEAIKALRLDREAHIWPNTERIDKLLAAYDTLKTAYVELTQKFDATEKDLTRLKETNENLEATIVHLQDDIHIGDSRRITVPEHQHEVDRMADEGCPHAGAIEN